MPESTYERAESTSQSADPLVFQLLEEAACRVAMRITDGPGQLLANAVFELAACLQIMDEQPDLAKEGLAALEDELRRGLRETQQLVFDLNPTLLSELGLVGTLRHYVSRFEGETGLPVEVDIRVPMERLPATVEIAVFRIIQEALANVRQHAEAGKVTIRMHMTESTLEVIVEDDGQGFDMSALVGKRQRHLGLVGMHDRARLIGGQLQIGSRNGGGTRVHLSVPRSPHGAWSS